MLSVSFFCFFFSSRRRHTRCALVTGVQTCALPILTGGGFTNLPPDRQALRAKLERAGAGFASEKEYPGDELYLMVLEDLDSGEVRGTCQIFGQVGQR